MTGDCQARFREKGGVKLPSTYSTGIYRYIWIPAVRKEMTVVFLTSIPLIICDGYIEVTYFPQSAFLFDNQIVRRFAGEKRNQDTF